MKKYSIEVIAGCFGALAVWARGVFHYKIALAGVGVVCIAFVSVGCALGGSIPMQPAENSGGETAQMQIEPEPEPDEMTGGGEPVAAPDLHPIASSPTFDSASYRVGETIMMHAAVRNDGVVASSDGARVRFYQRVGETRTEVGVPQSLGALTSRETATVTAAFVASAVGSYAYYFVIENVSSEVETTNNTSVEVMRDVLAAPVVPPTPPTPPIPPTPPDLQLSVALLADNTQTARVAARSIFTINSIRIENLGETMAAGTFYRLRYYQGASARRIAAGDMVLSYPSGQSNLVGTLNAAGTAGDTIIITDAQFIVPAVAQSYYVGICVDWVPGEVNHTDNCSIAQEIVVVAPDLALTGFSVAASSAPRGGTISPTVVVQNIGGVQSEATTVIFRLEHLLDPRVGLTGSLSVPVLAPGASVTLTVSSSETITVPSTANITTDYFLRAVVGRITGDPMLENNFLDIDPFEVTN